MTMRIVLDLEAEEVALLLASHGGDSTGRNLRYKIERAELAAQLGRAPDVAVRGADHIDIAYPLLVIEDVAAPNWPDGVDPFPH